MQAPPSAPSRHPRALPGPGAAYAGAAVAGAVLSAVLTSLVVLRWAPLMALDTAVAEALHRSAVDRPGWVRVHRVLTDWVWDPWTVRVLLVAAVVWLVRRGDRRLAVCVAVAGAVGTVVQQGVKAAVGRPRPQWPDPVDSAHYAAFPSGHAMSAAFGCGLLVGVVWLHGARGWRLHGAVAAAVVSVAGVGWTRVYLGVHWCTDVAGGWLLGATLVAGTAAVHRRCSAIPGRAPLPPGK